MPPLASINDSTYAGTSPALWPSSERGDRITVNALNRRLAQYRDELALGPGLDFHSLRRSYVTHLIEDGWDPLFVQQQVGHEHASTTAIYTCVSSDFRTRTLRRALDATLAQATTETTAAAKAWAGDGSHRLPMGAWPDQVPAFDAVRITVTA